MACSEGTLPVTSASNHEIRRHQVGIQLMATHMVKYIFNVLLTAVRNLGRRRYDLFDQNLGTNNLPGVMLDGKLEPHVDKASSTIFYNFAWKQVNVY